MVREMEQPKEEQRGAAVPALKTMERDLEPRNEVVSWK